MKAAHVLPWVSRNAGGLLGAVSGLARSLEGLDGLDVEVFGTKDRFSDEDYSHWKPVRVHATPAIGPTRLAFSPGMLEQLGRFAPDMVHSCAVWTYQAAIVNRWHERSRNPYVLSTHGTLDPWALARSRGKKAIARWLYQQRHFDDAACIHALNESELASIRQSGLRNPVCVVPNGVELPEARSQSPDEGTQRAPWEGLVGPGCDVLLYLGRIHPKKGLVNLLRAWGQIRRSEARSQRAGWCLAIAGWDEVGHEAELKDLATELEIPWADARATGPQSAGAVGPRALLFCGPQFGEAKAACYRECDAFVLPSFSEGLPMAVLEAWAYGLPVLMTPECNIPEGFTAGAAVKVVPEVASIATGLLALSDMSVVDRDVMGKRGRALVEARFAWPRIATQMKAVYDWVLGGGAAPDAVHQ